MNPHITNCDDESIVIEWITKDWRFWIALEKDQKKSSWGFVGKSVPFDIDTNSGYIPNKFFKILHDYLNSDTVNKER